MSEGGGRGHGNLLWETQSWAFSNSDNSGGSESKSVKQPPTESNSNSPTATVATEAGRKRGQSEVSKNMKGGIPTTDWNENKGGESDHEIHIWTERERRKKMRNMFSNLHALLPQLPAKADKSTIVDEAVSYIKTLQQSIQKLQKQRLEVIRGATTDYNKLMVTPRTPAIESRETFIADQTSSKNWAMINSPPVLSFPCFPQSFQTWSSPNVVLSVSGNDAQISVCTARKPGTLTTIFYILEKHKLEVVTAHITSDYFRSMFMIHVNAISQRTVSDECPRYMTGLPSNVLRDVGRGRSVQASSWRDNFMAFYMILLLNCRS
ncbi:transcription factor bHLH95 isoform X2 [Magnolia sinica]|uniref:transcription factor bHLH95 isoform X2 n=1 Tax=Magnolia sinica TaxID=86752 RepID=UPI00265A9524|nr:transcription factor bHLH95 isoform X2 [Magnolia sinica]